MKQPKVLTKHQEIQLLAVFVLCLTVSITPSTNKRESSNDFVILIMSFISSFEINNANPLPIVTAPFPLIFLPSLSITLEVALLTKLLTNPGKLSLAQRMARYIITFLPNSLSILH